jgi:hypothetical protein
MWALKAPAPKRVLWVRGATPPAEGAPSYRNKNASANALYVPRFTTALVAPLSVVPLKSRAIGRISSERIWLARARHNPIIPALCCWRRRLLAAIHALAAYGAIHPNVSA